MKITITANHTHPESAAVILPPGGAPYLIALPINPEARRDALIALVTAYESAGPEALVRWRAVPLVTPQPDDVKARRPRGSEASRREAARDGAADWALTLGCELITLKAS